MVDFYLSGKINGERNCRKEELEPLVEGISSLRFDKGDTGDYSSSNARSTNGSDDCSKSCSSRYLLPLVFTMVAEFWIHREGRQRKYPNEREKGNVNRLLDFSEGINKNR